MDIQLTSEIERMVQAKVETGRFGSATDVMHEALRQMEDREQVLEEIRQKIAAGAASAKSGRMTDSDEFFDQMEAELDEEIRAEEEQAHRELAGSR